MSTSHVLQTTASLGRTAAFSGLLASVLGVEFSTRLPRRSRDISTHFLGVTTRSDSGAATEAVRQRALRFFLQPLVSMQETRQMPSHSAS
jgi:hypothetical protein